MQNKVLIDTGPFVAIFNQRDKFNDMCLEKFRKVPLPAYTTWAVVTELFWMIQSLPEAQKKFLELVKLGQIVILDLPTDSIGWLENFLEKYSDIKVQLADASLMYFYEAGDGKFGNVFTLDVRDFSVFRVGRNRRVVLL